MQRQMLELRREVLGLELPDTLTRVSHLALVLSRQGKYVGAEQVEQQTLELREKTMGFDHSDTLTSIANLALTY